MSSLWVVHYVLLVRGYETEKIDNIGANLLVIGQGMTRYDLSLTQEKNGLAWKQGLDCINIGPREMHVMPLILVQAECPA